MKTYTTGAVRSDDKSYYRGITHEFIRRVAGALLEGHKKYDKGDIYNPNWKKGNDVFFAEAFDHLIDHLYKWKEGDTTEDHLAHAGANLQFLMYGEAEGLYSPKRGGVLHKVLHNLGTNTDFIDEAAKSQGMTVEVPIPSQLELPF